MCLRFQAMGEWTQLSVLTAVDSETMSVVWDLSDKTLLADGLWIYGQTKVNTRQVQIIATKGDGTNGWAALDDITMENDDVCSTIPENAATPTSSQETTKTPGIHMCSLSFWQWHVLGVSTLPLESKSK